ncbi:hypothetical protein TIFTF001_030605 [Ficus carica]|uniref:Uncharacterized protein n=1 Tax=Ficus carica TaxID=3494 RepID=A0AA88DUG7_FICCA|nr:hypothetical protein TIFTF001_030605 [Ficus carica]
MNERASQEIQGLDHPAPTGSQITHDQNAGESALAYPILQRKNPSRPHEATRAGPPNIVCPSRPNSPEVPGPGRRGPPDTVCPSRPNTREVPGPRRRNRATCNGMLTKVGLRSISEKKPKTTIGGTRAGPSNTFCSDRLNTREVHEPQWRNAAPCTRMPTRAGHQRTGLLWLSRIGSKRIRPNHGNDTPITWVTVTAYP